MRSETFLQNFGAIAGAPRGESELRALVISLALRGQLVDQDPDDEPAARLLERVDELRTAVLEDGGRRSARPCERILHEDVPYECPPGWQWARLESIALPQAGFAFKSDGFNQAGIGMPLIRIRDIANDWTECHFDGDFRSEFLVYPGDYLVGMDGNFNIHRWRGPEALLNQRVARLQFFSEEMARPFVAWALQARVNELHGSRAYTTVQHLSGKQISASPIPVPPAAEQARIVARVDELMGLCDDLNAREEHRRLVAARVQASALHALTEAEAGDELNEAWERVTSNWDALTDPVGVGAIRQTILELAVRGKIVEQDASEEPAEALIEQLGTIRGRTSLGLPDGLRPPLPPGWRWASFGEASINRDSERIPLRKADREQRPGPYDYYGASGVIDQIDDYLFDGELLLIGEDGANLVLRSTPIAFVAMGRFWVNNHAHVIDSVDHAALRYLGLVINATDLRPHLTGIAQPKLNQARLNKIPIPLPPLAEQARIVAEVDRLTECCDGLDKALQAKVALSDVLAQSATRAMAA